MDEVRVKRLGLLALTMPEHVARTGTEMELHPEMRAAYDFVEKHAKPHGHPRGALLPSYQEWVVREAFLAGITFATERAKLEGENEGC